jgi:hypothetical protein
VEVSRVRSTYLGIFFRQLRWRVNKTPRVCYNGEVGVWVCGSHNVADIQLWYSQPVVFINKLQELGPLWLWKNSQHTPPTSCSLVSKLALGAQLLDGRVGPLGQLQLPPQERHGSNNFHEVVFECPLRDSHVETIGVWGGCV